MQRVGWLFSAQLPVFCGWAQGRDLGGSVTHESPARARTWLLYPCIHALTLLKQSRSSWEQFLVWGWIQSIAACFLEIAAASGLVISPAASLLPPGSSPAAGAVFISHTLISAARDHFCSCNGHAMGWCVGGEDSDVALAGNVQR